MREERRKTPLSLMEQVVMVFVFAMAAAICVQAFVLARNMSLKSIETDHALNICQSMAEEIKENHGKISNPVRTYDDKWVDNVENYTYIVSFIVDKSDSLCKEGTIEVRKKDKTLLYELPVAWQEVDVNE